MSQNPMITVEKLKKIYQTNNQPIVALDNINLTIEKGEVFGIIGYSGAGKSTLIRCFNMLESPTSGTIRIDGKEITSMSQGQLKEQRKEIGMIFQHFNLLSSRTVSDNIAYPLEIAGVKKETIKSRVAELMELVGLTKYANSYPAQLSGGQKQRVGIARAIANNPKVLLCDEATSALDPKTTLSILDLLKEINKQLGLTIVLITHEMEVIKNICDRVAVIDQGGIAELGTVLQVFSQPKTRIALEFVKQVTNYEVPDCLLAQFAKEETDSYKLLQLSFLGEATGKSIISDLIRKHDININILHGQIDRIQSQPYGTLVVSLEGTPIAVTNALQYLKEHDIRIEVLTSGN